MGVREINEGKRKKDERELPMCIYSLASPNKAGSPNLGSLPIRSGTGVVPVTLDEWMFGSHSGACLCVCGVDEPGVNVLGDRAWSYSLSPPPRVKWPRKYVLHCCVHGGATMNAGFLCTLQQGRVCFPQSG